MSEPVSCNQELPSYAADRTFSPSSVLSVQLFIWNKYLQGYPCPVNPFFFQIALASSYNCPCC